jgi:hypothetical protein
VKLGLAGERIGFGLDTREVGDYKSIPHGDGIPGRGVIIDEVGCAGPCSSTIAACVMVETSTRENVKLARCRDNPSPVADLLDHKCRRCPLVLAPARRALLIEEVEAFWRALLAIGDV